MWSYGQCKTVPVADHLKVWDVVRDSLHNRPGSQPRLYFLDGTFPGELPTGTKYEDMPGQLLPFPFNDGFWCSHAVHLTTTQ